MRAPVCLITQPIHPDAMSRLQAAGVELRTLNAPGPTTDREAFHLAINNAIADVDAVIVRDAGLRTDAILRAGRLCVIGNHGVGVNRVDVSTASARGIAVTNTPGTNARSVAEHTITLMLAVAHRVPTADHAARHGAWHFRFTERMRELHGKTLGIVGLGRIGRMVADSARSGLGMHVVIWSPSLSAADRSQLTMTDMTVVERLNDLLALSDVVSLHRPARPDTRHTINAEALALMKDDAILVNTSRGDLIDELALAQTLSAGRLFGAGLDVFEHEPLPVDSPLARFDKIVMAPHVGGSTQEALRETAMCCVEQVLAVFAGHCPRHLVDTTMWEKRRYPFA